MLSAQLMRCSCEGADPTLEPPAKSFAKQSEGRDAQTEACAPGRLSDEPAERRQHLRLNKCIHPTAPSAASSKSNAKPPPTVTAALPALSPIEPASNCQPARKS